jgi:hypothetical protein
VVKNTAIGDVGGVILSGAGGAGVGEAIYGPACAIYGVHADVAAWAWFTGKNGVF